MGWPIRPGRFYAALAIARNIRKFFDSSHSISGQTRTEAGQVQPRWFGQDLSEVPDSGIGRTQDSRTGRNNVGWCDQHTPQPTSSQPIRRKRRAGDRVVKNSDVGRDVRRERARWGTPRKRALFGPDGQNSVSSGSDMAEDQLGWPPDDEYPAVVQSGWPPEDEYLEEARSPRVELVDAVARLENELAEFRTEFGYGSTRRPEIPSQTSGGSGFTSTSVPMYAGRSSWDQYQQVFEAIVCSNE